MTTHKTEYCDWNNISQCAAVLSSSLKKTLSEFRAPPTTMKENNNPGVCLCVLLLHCGSLSPLQCVSSA